ncbi:hypothetical protein [Dactylosporangium sp. NPDC005555]|uniref:LGFP repeat-containing protein n=1 Tax=Dactylosporangium sp. NPDC005555 TaxID=3154889 RepID=UPI0033BF0971
MWHGRRLDAPALEALSASHAAELVAELPHNEAVQALAAMQVAAAAEVTWALLRRHEALAVSLLGRMNRSRSQPVVDALAAKFDWLSGLPTAAAEIERVEIEQGSGLGAKVGGLARAGTSAQGTTGFFRRYAHGQILWSPPGGPQIVPQAFVEYLAGTDGIDELVGFPLSPVTPSPPSPGFGTVGAFQHYEAINTYNPTVCKRLGYVCGATVYRSVHGEFVTWDEIGEHYEHQGGAGSWLGFPVSDEAPAGPSRAAADRPGAGTYGTCQRFEGGTVYSLTKAGLVEVRRDIADYHDRLGGAQGVLGFPVGGRKVAAISPFGTAGEFQRFEGGSDYPADIVSQWTAVEGIGGCTVYVSEPHGVHAVGAAIGALYERMDGTGSWLGFPTSGEIDGRTGPDEDWRCYATFEGGAIYWTAPRGAVAVPRGVVDLLTGDTQLAQRLGFPIADEERVVFFEHGVVTIRDGVAEAWVRPA